MSELAELLERFRRGGELLAMSTTGVAGAELDFVPGPGKWCIRQIVCHLMDSEMVGRDRLSRVIAEENPSLIWYDQDAWATKLDYSRRKLSVSVELFRRVRAENFELIKDLPEATWQRVGTHSVNGTVSLLDLLRMYAEHAENHVMQIRNARVAYKASRA